MEDIDYAGRFCDPPSHALERADELYVQAAQGRGCDPFIGRRLDRHTPFFQRMRNRGDGAERFDHRGTLDFIDNAVDRSSGTIRARATVANPDFAITPGQFARLRVPNERPGQVLLLPPAAIVPDQSRQVVMTVGADGMVTPKPVEIGSHYRGLRVIRSGLAPDDTVVIDGLVRVRPGGKVTPDAGKIAMNSDE
jgi:RND family efflux transporter MFP subunit